MVETFVQVLLEMLMNAILVLAVMFIISIIIFGAEEKFSNQHVDVIAPKKVPDEELK